MLHDWDDRSSAKILRNVARAMDGRGTLLIAEFVVPKGNDASFAKLLDLNLMVMCPGGRERRRAELDRLRATAGFRVDRILLTGTLVSVIVGVPTSGDPP